MVDIGPTFEFTATLWEHEKAAWCFVTVPVDEGEEIHAITDDVLTRGFGSVKVDVAIGPCRWSTSLFPDKDSGSFVLPVKKEVRTKNGVAAGDAVEVAITIVGL
jgi:hypothetical protein